MSTAQLFLPFDISSAANFRAWGEGISLQLTACGWTKTADTGQVNWTTNPAVPGTNTYIYEIRQPASDPLQTGVTAYYIKIEYGQTVTAGHGTIRFSLGTSTNGAGTLTGYVIGPFSAHGDSQGSAGNAGATPYECDFSWDNSRMGMLLWRNLFTDATCFIGIERIKTTTGTDSSDGVTLVTNGGQYNNHGGPQMRHIIFGVGISNMYGANGSTPLSLPIIEVAYVNSSQATSDAFNNNIPISPLFPDYGKFGNPHTIVGFARKADVVEGGLLTTTFYGATRAYMAAKSSVCMANLGIGQAYALLMRFD